MASNKKPKKKYIPRDIRYPSLVTQINSFSPFEKAFESLLETGECQVDSNGTLIFIDSTGITQSFSSSLKVYLEIVDIFCKRNNIQYDIKSLHLLHNQVFEGIGLDEEIVDKAKPCLDFCKRIICTLPPKELFSILNTVRIGMSIEKAVPGNLKNPELLLSNIKSKVGELNYEEVLEKNKYFQELALKEPNNERVIKLRNVYVEYLAAYRFSLSK